MTTFLNTNLPPSLSAAIVLVYANTPVQPETRKLDRREEMKKLSSQENSPEAILKEMVHADRGTPQGDGVSHLVSAIQHLSTGRYEAALSECSSAQQGWPDGDPIIQFIRAHALGLLRRNDDAFSAFEASHTGLWLLFDSPNAYALVSEHDLEEWREDFYKRWPLPGLTQGLEGLLTPNLSDLEAGGEKIAAVLKRAQEDGKEDAVWSVIAQVEKELPAEAQAQIAEFTDFVRLLAIEDPFEGVAAIAKRISKVWPKDVDCVDAVREQRR